MDEDKKCVWPGFKNRWKVTKAIKEMWKPEETWSVYSIRTLAKCCDYSAGRVLARKAEHASDIISDGEYGRGCRRIKRKLTNVMVKGVMTMAVELMTIILKATMMILKIQMVVTVNLLM
ncbi:hypothetical protein Pcinc_000549 [Petrolisthes cinctipes]|uniref:Uncharacterized protein n=1 Tax=Petrolisthes cinctipes TaxID=88211 RepID=A0AAE1L472_PETCI|nr:hypothetical protein Pcinc_000549 [Petrolisthes cinctipes]